MMKRVMFMLVADLILTFLFCYPAMYLWNVALVPAVTVLNTVTWVQMFGIYVMARILFRMDLKVEMKKGNAK